MNQVILSGRLVYEPELKTTQGGSNYLSTRIAVPRNDKDKSTDFLTVRAWNNTAGFICKYFHKGDPIEIIGKMQTSSYTKQDGTKADEVFVFVTEVNFVLSKAENKPTVASQAPTAPVPTIPEPTGELPFEI